MTDDDDTPPIRLVTEDERQDHFSDYEPGTPVVQEPRMVRPPDPTDLAARIQKLEESHKLFQRILWLVVPTLLGGMVTALVYAADRIAASAERVGKTEAKLEAYKERLDERGVEITQLRATMEAEIGQLRAALMRLSGAEPHKPTSDVDSLPPSDSVTMSDQGAQLAPVWISGLVDLHTPKLQNGHGFNTPVLHSGPELQIAPQLENGMISRTAHVPSSRCTHITPGPRRAPSKSSSSRTWLAMGSGGESLGDTAQLAKSTATNTITMMRMRAPYRSMNIYGTPM